MKSLIFIAGAPGSGKSTVAKVLQQRLNSPLFEFGWIPEFRNTGDRTISYEEDEVLAFENLTLVAKNYIKHGFKSVIITDLDNKRITELARVFAGVEYVLFTLTVTDQEVLKSRVLDDSRSSGYRNWEEALLINQAILDRPALPNEVVIEVGDQTPEAIADHLMSILHTP